MAKKEISLLPREEDLNSTGARILHWATTVGRYVIVFTELIVISAFISRFWLDRKNADLSEIIRQQKAILESTQAFEQEFLLLKQKLEKIDYFYQSQPQYSKFIQTLVKSTPPQIVFENLTLDQDKDGHLGAKASLLAYSETAIVDFVSNLIVNPDIQTVDIQNIQKKSKENFYSINLSLIFNTAPHDSI